MRPWLNFAAVAVVVVVAAAGGGLRGADVAVAQTAAQKSAPPPVSTPPVSTPVAAPAPGRTPMPAIAKGKGDKCVAPTDWMRRFHMTALNHKRDDTVHDGIRTPQFSLKACIDCHAVSGVDGKAVTVKDERHFCRSCHDYAAVKVDCFECHASRPEGSGDKKGAALGPVENGAHGGAGHAELARLGATLGRYLGDAATAPNGVEGQRP